MQLSGHILVLRTHTNHTHTHHACRTGADDQTQISSVNTCDKEPMAMIRGVTAVYQSLQQRDECNEAVRTMLLLISTSLRDRPSLTLYVNTGRCFFTPHTSTNCTSCRNQGTDTGSRPAAATDAVGTRPLAAAAFASRAARKNSVIHTRMQRNMYAHGSVFMRAYTYALIHTHTHKYYTPVCRPYKTHTITHAHLFAIIRAYSYVRTYTHMHAQCPHLSTGSGWWAKVGSAPRKS